MTKKKVKKKDNKIEARIKTLEAFSTMQIHKINILTSEVALLKMAIKALGQQKMMIVTQDEKKEEGE